MLQVVKAPAHGFKLGRVGWSLASLAVLIALWEVIALIAASRYLPGPLVVVHDAWADNPVTSLTHAIAAAVKSEPGSFSETVEVAAAVGVPEINPVEVLIDSPAGNPVAP